MGNSDENETTQGSDAGRFDWRVEFAIDDKRRFQLPARWRLRDNPAENLRLLSWRTPDNKLECLLVLPEGPSRRLAERIESLPMNDPKAENLRRWYGGHGFRAKTDGAGRFTIPENLLQKAHLAVGNDAVAVGMGDRFQIWNADFWKEQEASDEASKDEAFELLDF